MMALTVSHQSRIAAQSAKPPRTTNQKVKSRVRHLVHRIAAVKAAEKTPKSSVGSEQSCKRKPGKHVVSRHSAALPDDVGLNAAQLLGGADALPDQVRPVL
jgi:hypothetical protein